MQLAFFEIETERRVLVEERTPEIAAAVEIGNLSNGFATHLFALRSARSEQELTAAGAEARGALAALGDAARGAPAARAASRAKPPSTGRGPISTVAAAPCASAPASASRNSTGRRMLAHQ